MEILVIFVFIGAAIFILIEGRMPIIPSTVVQKIAQAIAKAEGFYVQGSVPQRAKNPGDLELGDRGYGTIDGKTVFPSTSQGWQALYAQVQSILDNSSAIYGPDWTIQDIANEYVNGRSDITSDSAAWANNVADSLGVTPDTQIGQVTA